MDRLAGGRLNLDRGDQVLVSLRDHVRGPVHPHHDRHRHAHRPIFAARSAWARSIKPFDRTDWLPGAVLSTAVVTAGWGCLIATGSIDTIWPMFGIANQMLAVIALAVVTTVMFNAGRGRYACADDPADAVRAISTTVTAGVRMIGGRFSDVASGVSGGNYSLAIAGGLNLLLILFMIGSVALILLEAIMKWTARSQIAAKSVPPE